MCISAGGDRSRDKIQTVLLSCDDNPCWFIGCKQYAGALWTHEVFPKRPKLSLESYEAASRLDFSRNYSKGAVMFFIAKFLCHVTGHPERHGGGYCSMIIALILLSTAQLAYSQWIPVHLPDIVNEDDGHAHPVINKCCPLHKRYMKGQCVDKEGLTYSETIGELGEPPYTMVYENYTEQDRPVIFRFHEAQPNCTSRRIEKIILQPTFESEFEYKNETEYLPFAEIPEVVLSIEGHLVWRTEGTNASTTYPYDSFCIDQINATAYVAVLCEPTCNEDRPCVRKCCPRDSVFDLRQGICVPVENKWKPRLYDDKLRPIARSDQLSTHYIVGIPDCEFATLDTRTETKEKIYILSNGSLVTTREDYDQVTYTRDIFCIDGIVSDEIPYLETGDDVYTAYNIGHYSGLEIDQVALLCLPDDTDEKEIHVWIYPLFGGVMFVSAIFLILTALVYLALWEYQNIHGWLQFSYVLSLFFAYGILAFVQIFSSQFDDLYPHMCRFFGSVIHFSFLSAFFWLTSMNFDLWWTFSGCHPLRASTRNREKKRFAFFAILSWGGAIAIASTAVLLDTAYEDVPVISEYLPQFGKKNCYFHNEWAKLPFFYAPIGFLLTVNIIFFLSTILSLHKLQKDTRFATRQSSKQDKKRFVLFLKLFVVMGVCWIFEMISWLSLLVLPKKKDTLQMTFLFTDIINSLQGIFIFVIFTCKPNTCKQLEGQFKKMSGRLEESRDKTIGSSVKSKISRFFVIGLCAITLPLIHGLRMVFSYCGRPTRTLDGRRNISHNTVTSTFEKSRKASDSSACTTLSVIDAGSYEMDTTY